MPGKRKVRAEAWLGFDGLARVRGERGEYYVRWGHERGDWAISDRADHNYNIKDPGNRYKPAAPTTARRLLAEARRATKGVK